MRSALFLILLVLGSCSKSNFDPSLIVNGLKPGTVTSKQAALLTYQYAFSGQVLDEKSRAALTHFSVEVAGSDPSISGIINGLGEKNGIFHISRNPASSDHRFVSVPIIISASGYEPVVQMLDLGADCQAANCPGLRPTPFLLAKIPAPAKVESKSGLQTYLPAKVQEWINSKGTTVLFQDALNKGKIDDAAEAALTKAKNGQQMSQVIILLNGSSGNQTPHLINDLLGSVKSEKIKSLAEGVPGTAAALSPMLAMSNPDVAASLVSANLLLPYLTPISDRVGSSKSGPMGQVVAAFLKEKNYENGMLTLVAALSGKGATHQRPTLAMSSLMPMVENILSKNQTPQSPIESLVSDALMDPEVLNTIITNRRMNVESPGAVLISNLQPLIQGLSGKNGADLISQFNQLIKKDGILALKNYNGAEYPALAPYLEPAVRVLQSSDARDFAKAIAPLLKTKNPGTTIAALSENPILSAVIFPGTSDLLKDAIPGKQLFAAQLIHGLINGDFKDLKITQDLKGSPAVVVSGQARDIFKLSQLANVSLISAFK